MTFSEDYPMGSDPSLICPYCSSDKVRRVINSPPVIYRAEGYTKKVKRDGV
jgi:predicted nucleic acid-binding Zn ribbon protein